MNDAAPAPSADAAQPAEPPATDDLATVQAMLRESLGDARQLRRERAILLANNERQAREIERWRNVTARADPDDCAAGIKELYGRWKDAEAEIESLRAECGLRQIQGYKEGEEAASARLYEAEAEQLTRDMRQRAERAERDLDKLRSDANKSNRILGERCEKLEAERDALRADADRYRWLRPRLYSIDFDYSETHATVLVFEAPVHPLGPGTALDAAIDAARAKVKT